MCSKHTYAYIQRKKSEWKRKAKNENDFLSTHMRLRTNRHSSRIKSACNAPSNLMWSIQDNLFLREWKWFSSQRKYLLRLGFGHCSSIALPPYAHTLAHSRVTHSTYTNWRPKACTPKRKTILLMLNSLDQIDYGFLSFFFLFLNTTSYIIIVNWWRPSKKLRKNERAKGEKSVLYVWTNHINAAHFNLIYWL